LTEPLVHEEEENMPLQPLNNVINKFKKRRQIVNWLMVLAMPSAILGIAVFLIFTVTLSSSPILFITFGFLVFSSLVSYIAVLYVPGTLDGVIRKLELTVQEISFSVSLPIGDSPQERLFNQLKRTDQQVRQVLNKNPNAKNFNVQLKGKTGKEYLFDVFINNVNSIGRFFGSQSDLNVFVKRFDQIDPLSVNAIKNVREAVQDILSKAGRKYPTRVLIVSTSGYEDEVFKYVRSKEGFFSSKYLPLVRRIEIIREKIDGNYDVLSF
jgi:hypothetical protein